MQITVDQAREYFRDPSQQIHGNTPDELPVQGVEYWSEGDVCGIFHLAPWPRVWMAHYAVKPSAWGHTVMPARKILKDFWETGRTDKIIGWTPKGNRAALSLSRRIGFTKEGEMHLPDKTIIMQGWVP